MVEVERGREERKKKKIFSQLSFDFFSLFALSCSLLARPLHNSMSLARLRSTLHPSLLKTFVRSQIRVMGIGKSVGTRREVEARGKKSQEKKRCASICCAASSTFFFLSSFFFQPRPFSLSLYQKQARTSRTTTRKGSRKLKRPPQRATCPPACPRRRTGRRCWLRTR